MQPILKGVAADEEAFADLASRYGAPSAASGAGNGLPFKWALVCLAVLVAAILGGPLLYFHVIESPTPGLLRLPRASGVASGPLAPGPLSGLWKVAAGSQAGYRVGEVLLGQHHTAVGRTSAVSGGIELSGATVTAADFTVDLASLKSDVVSRDAQFHGYIMKTYDYPDARFHLTVPIALGVLPATGAAVSSPATGELSMRGVTRTVSFSVDAERLPGEIDINAEIPVTFARWHIPDPSFAVAQVDPTGTIEVLLHLEPAR